MLKVISYSYKELGSRDIVEELIVEKTIFKIIKFKLTYARFIGEIFLVKKGNKYMIDCYPFYVKEQEIKDLYKKYFVH